MDIYLPKPQKQMNHSTALYVPRKKPRENARKRPVCTLGQLGDGEREREREGGGQTGLKTNRLSLTGIQRHLDKHSNLTIEHS